MAVTTPRVSGTAETEHTVSEAPPVWVLRRDSSGEKTAGALLQRSVQNSGRKGTPGTTNRGTSGHRRTHD